MENRPTAAWPDVLAEWNRERGELYRLRESDWRWCAGEQSLLQYRATSLEGVPVVLAMASAEGVAAGLSQASLWLSLWGRIEEGTEARFVAALVAEAARLGKGRVAIGGDEFHSIPGVPLDEPAGQRLVEALNAAGFEGAEAADLLGDAKSEAVTSYIEDALALVDEKDWTFAPVVNGEHEAELHAFLASEFPGRWTREFEFWLARADTRRAFWMTLKDLDGRVIGFARMAVRGRGGSDPAALERGWNPGALKLPLRSSTLVEARDEGLAGVDWCASDACLGPIGVSNSLRGQGAGRALLGLVLHRLREHNAGRICIDWTNAFKYYYPLRFTIARRYWTAWKRGAF